MKKIVLAVTGASGAVYGVALARLLLACQAEVHAIVSPHGRAVQQAEGESEPWDRLVREAAGRIVVEDYADLASQLASGSVPTDGMVVCPCSCQTLAAVAAGLGDNLITRAAHVHLKQRRPLVLAVREMPLSTIDIENQLRLSQAGAIIAPACPGFYCNPSTLGEVVDFVAARLAECVGIQHDLPVVYRGAAQNRRHPQANNRLGVARNASHHGTRSSRENPREV